MNYLPRPEPCEQPDSDTIVGQLLQHKMSSLFGRHLNYPDYVYLTEMKTLGLTNPSQLVDQLFDVALAFNRLAQEHEFGGDAEMTSNGAKVEDTNLTQSPVSEFYPELNSSIVPSSSAQVGVTGSCFAQTVSFNCF